MLQAMPGLKARAKTVVELVENAYYLRTDSPLDFDEKAANLINSETVPLLVRLTERLRDASDFSAAEAEVIVRDFAEAEQLKLGKVAQPLRAALTGRAVSPGVFDVIETLGRDEVLARLDAATQG
jgi:glutamyl-tRNA synthetase